MRLIASLSAVTAALLSVALAADDFTPERLITAPRPSSDFQVSPDKTRYLVSVSHAHLDGSPTSHQIHLLQVPQNTLMSEDSPLHLRSTADKEPSLVLPGVSFATWLDDEHILFLNGSCIYAAPISSLKELQKLAQLPAPIAADSLKIVSTGTNGETKRLLFTADVYPDGALEGVPRVETEANEEEWKRAKVYGGDNGAFFRHWDQWVRPDKRSQIFTATLSAPKKYGQSWSLADEGFVNLLQGTEANTPVPTFGGNGDWDASHEGVVFITKALELPQAWHTKSDVYYVSFKSPGHLQKLSGGEHGAVASPRFSPNGEMVAWLQMAKDGFESDRRVLQIYDLQEAKHMALLKHWDRSPSDIVFSAGGDEIYLVTEDYQQTKVFVTSLLHGASEVTLEFSPAQGSISNFVPLSNSVALVASSSYRHLTEVYLYQHQNKSLYPLTWFTGSKDSSLKSIGWGPEPEAFHYPSPDFEGESRWGWVHYPPGYPSSEKDFKTVGKGKKKWPLLVLIHGGPEGAWTDSWSFRWHPEVFAASGYLVVTLNPTGSTGFGQVYQDRILNNWGSLPYRDVIAGVRHILDKKKDTVDADRVAAAGASYGGYMVNWIQGHNDDGLFKALVCHDGIFNIMTGAFYPADELYFPESENGPGVHWDLTARQVYERYSPERHTAHWNTPQLIVHGAKDFRLVESEGIAAFNTLRRRGVDTRLLYFTDEGHWVNDPRNSLKWHKEIFAWVNKYIGSGPKQVRETIVPGADIASDPEVEATKRKQTTKGDALLLFQRR